MAKYLTKKEKLRNLKEVYKDNVNKVISDKNSWREFLAFYSKFYKYEFSEALLIFGQKPESQASGEVRHWNAVGRRVHKGRNGTPIYDVNDANGDIRYVFDITDTYGEDRGIPRNWTLPEKYRQAVLDELLTKFNVVPPTKNYSKNMKWAVEEYVHEACADYLQDLKYSVDGSLLEELDRDSLNVEFEDTVIDSVGYLVCERLGIEKGLYGDDELSFEYLSDFNTTEIITKLGDTVNQISKNVLTLVLQKIRLEAKNERTMENDQLRKSEKGIGNDSRGNNGDGRRNEVGKQTNTGEIRSDDVELSQGNILGSPPVSIDRGDSIRDLPASGIGSGGNERSVGNTVSENGETSNGGLFENSSIREGHSESNRGDNSQRSNLQAQININAEKEPTTGSFFNDDKVETNEKPTMINVMVVEENKQPYLTIINSDLNSLKEKIGGKITTISIEYDVDIIFSDDFQDNKKPNRQVEEDYIYGNFIIAKFDNNGEYTSLTEKEIIKYKQMFAINENLPFKIGDEIMLENRKFEIKNIDEESNVIRLLDYSLAVPLLRQEDLKYVVDHFKFPVAENINVSLDLSGDEDLETTLSKEDRFKFNPNNMNLYIKETILNGSNFSNSRARIYNFYNDVEKSSQAYIEFLKNEYGTGGGSRSFSDGANAYEEHDYKGLSINFGFETTSEKIKLTWTNVSDQIKILVNNGEYYNNMNEKEKALVVENTPITLENLVVNSKQVAFDDKLLSDVFDEPQNIISEENTAWEEVEKTGETSKSYSDENVEASSLGDFLDDEQELLNQETTDEIVKRKGITPFIVDDRVQNMGEIYNKTNLEGAVNFKITPEDGVGTGTPKVKYRRNIEAIKLSQVILSENRIATHEEQSMLSNYSGWGGLAQAFDEQNESWQNEFSELKSLLNSEDYNFARASTLNAHFTSTEVIDGIYKGLERLGFRGGNILEPSIGVGNFFGMMPDELLENSRLYGVELDPLTGKIAKQLYPNANIEINGFEETALPDNFFDCAIGNVPFGDYKLNDVKFDKYNLLIHDYFFCKTIDKVRADGVIAFITSKETMDKKNTAVRQYIAERAELLGAIRLPNTAFKQTAGTNVTSDILFLKKRDRVIDASKESWVHTGFIASATLNQHGENEQIPLNEYFIENPQMLLGEMSLENTQYGHDTTLKDDGRDLLTALYEAVEFLPKNTISNIVDFKDIVDELSTKLPADPRVKNYCYTVKNDEIYQRVDSVMEKKEFSKLSSDRVKSMINLREQIREILDNQLYGCTDDELIIMQRKLSNDYDTFFKKFGILNSKHNKRLFSDDADFPLLSALEDVDDDGIAKKAAIFSRRTISPYKKQTYAESSVEALPIVLNELGYVDIIEISKLTGKSNDETIEDLKGLIFKNPLLSDEGNENDYLIGWETADEYLSGNVVNKLDDAIKYSGENPIFEDNINALKAIQPIPIEAHEISVRIGSSWVDPKYYRQFVVEKFKIANHEQAGFKISYSDYTGAWHMDKPNSKNTVEAIQIFGTKRMDGFELFQLTLNQKSPKIYDVIHDSEGKEKSVVNQKETIAIREKQNSIKQEFKNWIFVNPERREVLCKEYNKLFNNERLRTYDGSHLTFPKMSPEIKLNKHQSDAVARVLYGGNTLLAHEVGAGKTYTMATAAMEMKRLGMAQKPMFVVPNHLISQWTNEFQRLYPTANILATTKKEFEKGRRQRFCARISTGEWDCVVIGHSQFEKIPLSKERQELKMRNDVESISEILSEIKGDKDSRITVKELEKSLKNIKYELKRLQESNKDNVVTFEQLGVDALFVDESHGYKNKYIFTKMNNISGLSKARAKKSTDMDMKCEYINEVNRGARSLCFSTGTPISNSMTEMYTVQTYLQRDELKKIGLNHFDNWAANFGEVVSALELAPSGQGYRVKERFAKFVNLPELMNIYRKVADIQTAEMLKLPVPKMLSGKPITIAVDPSPFLKDYIRNLVERARRIYEREVTSDVDNMLCVTNDGRNAALDDRCIDPNAVDFDGSKVNTCVRKVFEIYKETEADKLTQMIFCDLSTPKGGKKFSVYDDIRFKLENLGVKESEIKFIHEADSAEQKEKLFAQVRRGEVRILLGSTAKMGSGTNAQTKLKALHHLDCPYRPSDLEQRNGRIVRQGNKNSEVEIYQYVTKQSFDSYLWQIVENKQKFISQIMSGKSPTRSMEDIDETVLNFAEVKAIATGNPRIKLKMELDMEVGRLQVLESQFKANKYSLEDAVIKKFPIKISALTQKIKDLTSDIAKRGDDLLSDFKMTLGKQTFTERVDAGALLLKAVKSEKYIDQAIGTIKNFTITPVKSNVFTIGGSHEILLEGVGKYRVELSDSEHGSITRIENVLKNFESSLSEKQKELVSNNEQLSSAKIELTKPFEYEERIKEILSQLTEINAELDVDRGVDDLGVSENENDEDILDLENDDDENDDEMDY